ncbi:putative membrane protein [Sphingopyxis sp. OAS728]|uniref:cytochrome c oxidase assembly protein n=1 Tax=Sphingopyxis sp. OAS728 TaxID=2663823 RepID=UPI00178C020F|nr:cytochrome c oxidase assembly protein [Sphingopyxis sp. OAS728]MBE1529876.1 putative membrane protein [Sphingopyxis sp. OAS728]
MDQSWIPYCGAAPLPGDWLGRWNGDPLLLLAVAVTAGAAYRRAGVAVPFWAGFVVLFLLFVSPLCALSSALFSVRVAHHVMLTAVVAPLLVWGLPKLQVKGSAALWAALHVLLFWFWHAPLPYALALSSERIFWAMQLSLLASAVAVWAALREASPPTAIALLLAMMVQMGLLGALITFAGSPLYTPHYVSTQPWGLSPVEDQQLAGLIMWAPAAGFYLAAALWRGWAMLAPPAAPAR